MLSNVAHVKSVPGRRTDVNDAMWQADLLAHGLIRTRFVPPAAAQDLRSLTDTRERFVRERSFHVLRIDKLPEDANLKLGVVLSDILLGKSGRAVLEAIISGESDPQRLATYVSVRVKAGRAEVLEALRGRVRADHRFMLKLHLSHIDALDKANAEIEREVGRGQQPFRRAARLLRTISGLSATSANLIVSGIRIDISRFATPGHLLSWACTCSRNDEIAGKHRSTRLRRGGEWLKTALVQAAWSAIQF